MAEFTKRKVFSHRSTDNPYNPEDHTPPVRQRIFGMHED